MLKKHFFIKSLSAILVLLFMVNILDVHIALAQKEEKDTADYAKIKAKIAELEKMIYEYGKSPELESKIQELKSANEGIEKGAKEKEKSLSKETLEAKNKRIKDKEEKIQLSLMSSERMQELEINASVKKVPIVSFHYNNCKAILEDNIDICNNIQDEIESDNCKSQFRLFELFDELAKNKTITNKALQVCKKEFNKQVRATDNFCKTICNAYLTGETPAVSTYFQGQELLFMLALITGKDNYCSSIKSNPDRQDCISNAKISSAIKYQNASMCLSIENAVLRTSCEVYFSKKEDTCKDCITAQIAERRK